jgi:hypothetical protein
VELGVDVGHVEPAPAFHVAQPAAAEEHPHQPAEYAKRRERQNPLHESAPSMGAAGGGDTQLGGISACKRAGG